MAQAEVPLDVKTLIVRTPVGKSSRHPQQHVPVYGPARLCIMKNAGNSTH
jgi:hypothetical protein